VAELVDALDSKSSLAYPRWGFDSPLRHRITRELVDALRIRSFQACHLKYPKTFLLRTLAILISLLAPLILCAQHTADPTSAVPFQHTVLRLSQGDTSYSLPHTFIVQGSEIVVLDSVRQLHRTTDYQIEYFRGVISLQRKQLLLLLADSSVHSIAVSYQVPAFSLRREYSIRSLIPVRDSGGGISRRAESSLSKFSMDDVFGSGLQKSGSIFRGLTVGSNRDLALNSGFRMQLAGKLSSELDIAAALTDENVPIQPEGTTQTLRELDRVFIQLTSPRFGATLGDFVYDIREPEGGEFGRLSRKLQGANGVATLHNLFDQGSTLRFGVTGATARGKYASNQFQGAEGTQGPYLLTGQDGGGRPIIIAGTEKVYVNGQLMTRGETNDYTIDYSTGELFFSARRLITNASRITVDFEYTDRQFTRNLVGVTAGATAMDNRLQVFAAITQEADDPASPIDLALDDSLRSIIAASGTDRYKASVSGLLFAGRDSATLQAKGQYVMRDTLLNGKRRPFLLYAPGDPLALYSVTFSPVAAMPPDSLGYNRANTGGYALAGLGKGSYLPVQFLPIPQLHRVMNGRLSFAPRPDVMLRAEYALSSFDQNRLSANDGEANRGGAYKVSAEYRPKNLQLGTLSLGEVGITLSDRFVDRRFVSLDRTNEIEFNRNWNIDGISLGDEEIRQADLMYRPVQSVELGASYGYLERQGSARSTRITSSASIQDSALPAFRYGNEFIRSEDLTTSQKSDWIRQTGSIASRIWSLNPALRVAMEDRQDRIAATDSLQRGSFRYLEIAPGISFSTAAPIQFSAELQLRTEDSASARGFARAFSAVTQLYDMRLREWRSFSTSISLALRRTNLSDDFISRGMVGGNTVLVRSQFRYAPWQRALDSDLLYEFSRERSAAMKRVFVRVPRGTGNYSYKGDLNQNGVADEGEFEQTRFDGEYVAIYVPSDQFVPVLDLRTGLRMRFTPSKLFPQPTNALEKVLASISTETVARVEEKSSEADARRIYALNLSRFLNDSTTITGTNLFTQDVYLFEADPKFSLRFRFNQREGLLRLVGSIERTASRERSVRVRTQLLREIGNQTEYTNKIDQLNSSTDSPRERDLHSDAIKTEFSYRPYPEWEIGFGLGASRIVNRFGGLNSTADLNNQFLHLTYSILSVGQLRGELDREDVRITSPVQGTAQVYPYEFTNGGVVGKTILWRLAFDYRISQYIQVTVNYDGRSEGGRGVVHTARAEARAFF
jgi:hypothetical protein